MPALLSFACLQKLNISLPTIAKETLKKMYLCLISFAGLTDIVDLQNVERMEKQIPSNNIKTREIFHKHFVKGKI